MAKQGQHKQDFHDPRIADGRNNPEKSQTFITGPYKKHETYQKQAFEHEDPGRQSPPTKKIERRRDTRREPGPEGKTRARHVRSGRSGSDSNASSGTRGY